MEGRISILVLHRGWVFVGRIFRNGSQVELRNAYNIRRWGTTAGLGQLAANGPLSDTILDPSGVVRVHELAVVYEMECDPAKWEATCKAT